MSIEQQANSLVTTSELTPLDETVWKAWLAKGRASENSKRGQLNRTVRYFSAALLMLVAAGNWSNLAPYDVAVRFSVAAAALFIVLQTFRSADYAVTAAFGLVAVLYNPIAPVFSFAGDWQRGLMIGTALLFMVSFYWQPRMVQHA